MASQVENIKWVPGTKLIVDGFAFVSPSCQHYFLTHCHSDHTVGLTRSFNAGTIWCSPVSARLLAAEWGLKAPTVRELQLHRPVMIAGVAVTALDANHCPGAIMLLFEVPSGQGGAVRSILHTGDCRWHDGLYTASCLAHKRIHTLMLDTTYAAPKHTFPPQQEAIRMMVQWMQEALQEEPDTLLVVSCYHIGKERAFLGAAAALGLKVYVPAAKLRVLQLLDLPQHLLSVLSMDPCSQLHVGCTSLQPDELQTYLAKQQQQQRRDWKRVMGFRATGWSYRRSAGPHVQRPSASVALVGIPYSEHSSWTDLRQCVGTLRPQKLIPTVNASTRSAQQALVDRFADLMDLSCDKGRIDAYLVRTPPAVARLTAHALPAAAPSAADAGSTADCAVPHAGGTVEQVQAVVVPARCTEAGQHAEMGQSGCGAVACLAAGPKAASSNATSTVTQQTVADSSPNCSNSVIGRYSSTSKLRLADQSGLLASLSSNGQPAASATGLAAAAPKPTAFEAANAAAPGMAHAGIGDVAHMETFDLSSVDVSEQQRLLEDAERLQRLRRSLLMQAARQSKRNRGRGLGIKPHKVIKKA